MENVGSQSSSSRQAGEKQMRCRCHAHFVCFSLALALGTLSTPSAPTVFAQRARGPNGPGTMSLGSTWTRHSDTSPATGSRRAIAGSWRASGPATRFFGGVSVGRGFYPFYSPGYFANSPWIPPGYGYPLGCWNGVPGFQVSFGSTRFGAFSQGLGPVLPPWYEGGFTGYSVGPSSFSRGSTSYPAYRTPVSHSRINDAPRVEFGPSFGKPMAAGLPPRIDFSSIKWQVQSAVDEVPVVGEFTPSATENRDVTTLDRIESQRLQMEGDRALRNGDSELARTFFQAAVRAAPNRQTPWIRTAWVHVFQKDFPEAAAAMKRGLMTHDEGAAWIQADHLLHNEPADGTWLSDASLLNWLLVRPGSADRLLLAAGFQYFLGNDQAGSDLLELSRAAGISRSHFEALERIATNPRDRTRANSAGPLAPRSSLEPDWSNQSSGNSTNDQFEAAVPPGAGAQLQSAANTARESEFTPALRLPLPESGR